MKTIKLKIGDSVELFNGTKGHISDVNHGTALIEISNKNSYPQWFHMVNVKLLNGVDIEELVENIKLDV